MHQVSIKPQWTIRQPGGAALAERTVALLVSVAEHGSLLQACTALKVSYRHAWQLIRQGEAQLGAPLLLMERGKGSSLSPMTCTPRPPNRSCTTERCSMLATHGAHHVAQNSST